MGKKGKVVICPSIHQVRVFSQKTETTTATAPNIAKIKNNRKNENNKKNKRSASMVASSFRPTYLPQKLAKLLKLLKLSNL